jgi:GTP-binding protein
MLNPFAQARFLLSCASPQQCPRDDAPEIAFCGRSNAGKSTALNAICGQHGLAKVSKTPGRTQLLNLFTLPGGARLVDLPGYGYAKVPETTRRSWDRMIGGYIEARPNLRGLVLIMDCRHPLTDYDRQMLAWVQSAQRVCHILLTKADKLGYGAAKNQLLAVRRELAAAAIPAQAQLFSGETRLGLEEAQAALAALLGLTLVTEPEKKEAR